MAEGAWAGLKACTTTHNETKATAETAELAELNRFLCVLSALRGCFAYGRGRIVHTNGVCPGMGTGGVAIGPNVTLGGINTSCEFSA